MFRILVKRTLPLLVAAAVVAAAPAASAQPKAHDFELSVPNPSAHAAQAGGSYKSPKLHAPGRFNTVGMRWRGGSARVELKMRVKKSGGKWTRWQAVESQSGDAPDPRTGEPTPYNVTAPAWAGQSDWVQFKANRPISGATFHFVEATGARRPVAHAAAADKPAIVTRDEWGAQDCKPRTSPAYGEVKAAIIHHTVNLNDYTPEEAPDIVLGICRYHRNSNGWNDIGYNFLVDKYGTIYEGRAGGVDQAVIGAQAQGFNSQTTGIANIGTFTDVPQTQVALEAIAKLIRWKLPLSGAPTAGDVELTSAGGNTSRYPAGTVVTKPRVLGHRDTGQTECPGDALYAQLPELREMVGSLQPVTGTTGTTKIDVSAASTVLYYPAGTQLTGTLSAADGSRIGSAAVELQRQTTTGSFKTITRGTTGPDGAYAFPFTPSKKAVVRVRFAGDGTHGAAASTAKTLQVRPALTATSSLKRMKVKKDLLRVKGTITPTKSFVRVLVVPKSGKGKTARYTVPVKSGRYVARIRIQKRGLYRVYVAFNGDSKNLSIASSGMFVRVGSTTEAATQTDTTAPPAETNGGVGA